MEFSVGIEALKAAATAKSRPLDGVFVAMAAIGEGRADPAAFVSGSRAGRLASPGQKDSWHARGMQ
jgi:hypothetical protein